MDDTITKFAADYPKLVDCLVGGLEKTGIVMDYFGKATFTATGMLAGKVFDFPGSRVAGGTAGYMLHEGINSTATAAVETGLEALVASVERSQGARAAKAVHNLATRGLMVASATRFVKGAKGLRAKPGVMGKTAPAAGKTAGQAEAAGVLGRTHVEREATFLQQMSGKVNRHGAEAKALRETREARSAGLEKLAQRQETELFLKHNKGSRQAFERKVEALDDLAKRGKLAKTQSVRDPSVTDKYRDTLLKRAEREWQHSDPEKFQRMKEKFLKLDADHLHELQLGGVDHFSALTMLDQGVNRSVGAQLGHQLRKLPDGTKVKRVLEKGEQ